MRYNIDKKHSTKTERIFYEVLKELKVSYKHRWIVCGYEIDFVIDKYCIEIDGHEQNPEKNSILIKNGYSPIHLHNKEITYQKIIQLIKTLTNYVN